jgi:hemerythrin-like metal-binding protein
MTCSPVIVASDIPVLGVSIMNDTHHEEIELINTLNQTLEDYLGDESLVTSIDEQLAFWLKHTQQHFERENSLMEQYNLPVYGVHSSEHHHVLGEMEMLFQAWYNDRDIEKLTHYVRQDWPSWFRAHVASMDMITAQLLSQFMD